VVRLFAPTITGFLSSNPIYFVVKFAMTLLFEVRNSVFKTVSAGY
jgi:hypothetical protein